MQDNMHQYTYAFADVLILELILRPVSSFYQCRLSCCVYVDCFTLVSCPCLFELTLSLIWSLPHWTMSCAMKNKVHKHTWTFFAVCISTLIFELISGSFELCFELWPFVTNASWAAVFTYYIYLGVLGMFVWAHFELDFEPSPLEFELSQTQTYMCLCWCSPSLLRYLRSFWALFWAFTNLISAAACTSFIYLGVLWVSVWAHFELELGPSPLEFELSHAEQSA